MSRFSDFIQCRIQHKIVLLIILIMLFFLLSMSFAIKKYIPPVLNAHVTEKGMTVGTYVANHCVNLLLTDDLVAIYDLVTHETNNSEKIVYIIILDHDNSPIIHTFSTEIPQELLAKPFKAYPTPYRQSIQLKQFGPVLDIALPIETNGNHLGTVRLGVTFQNNQTIVWLFVKHFFIILLLTTLVAFILAIFLTNRFLLKPIKDLIKGARRVGLGDKSHPIPVTSTDEIGELTSEFNLMTNKLRSKDQSNKDAYDEIRLLRNYLSNIIDTMPSMLLGVNVEGKITLWNQKIAHMTETPATIAQGRELTEIMPQMAHNMVKIEKSITTRKICSELMQPHMSEDGIRYEDMTIFPLIANGIEGAVIRIDDVTQRKELEDALLKANNKLEIRVEERTKELHLAHKKLLHSEKLAAIGSLSASIAHEFNNPLAGITNVIHGIKRRATYNDDDAMLIDMAIKECDRIRDLIKNLQEFNRPSHGNPSSMLINKAIDSLLMLTRQEFIDKGITLRKNYTASIPPIVAVSDQIKQVILNLLNNASFACQYGDTITITTSLVSDSKVSITIEDNGNGIAPDNLDHIFEPFFTTKPDLSGTGLGLSICFGIIKDHGGEIEVKSTLGKGSLFSVILPMNYPGASPLA